MVQLFRAQSFDHLSGQSQDELGFYHASGGNLMSGVGVHLGGIAVVIAHVHVSQQENPFPRHQHVVEEDHRVHLFEA